MKSSFIVVLLSVMTTLALVACVALVLVVFVDNNEPTGSAQTAVSKEDYWGNKLSQLNGELAKTSTTTRKMPSITTTTAKPTTERSWFTAYTGNVTVADKSTTTAEATTTTATTTQKTSKTTRPLTQAELDMVYNGVYEIVMEEYKRYRAIQLDYIADLNEKIAKHEEQKQAITAQHEKDIDALYERFKHEFFPIASAEASLHNTYQNNIASINRTIAALEAEKKSAQDAIAISESELDAVIQAKYYEAVEELQQSTLS